MNSLLNAAPHINTIRLYEGKQSTAANQSLYQPYTARPLTSAVYPPSTVVDPTLQYDDFMTDMNRRGIYVIVPLTPAKGWCTLDRDGTPPLTAQPTCYPSCLLTHAQHVINLFHPYPNVLLFTVGNEILNSGRRWAAAACVKSFTRDVQRFMRQCETEERSRRVPLLYAAADNAMSGFTAEENDRLKADYLTCGDDEDARIDVMGVNLFRYCSDTCTFHSCESNQVTSAFSTSTVPVLLTEYGCGDFAYHINHTQQTGINPFTETALLYSPLMMAGSFSGGCAYTYGVRGGNSFAFFDGGGRSISGEAGLLKRCGYPDGLCRVDAYERQLAAVEEGERQRDEKRRQAKTVGEAEEELDDSEGGGEDGTAAACPMLLGVDLTIADSRQGADGYEEVSCQAGVGRSASVEEERERQEHEREQQKLDKEAEKERQKKQAEHEDEDADNDVPKPDTPGTDTRAPVEAGDASDQQQQPQPPQHNAPAPRRANSSLPIASLPPPDEPVGAADEGDVGQSGQPSERSTAERRWKVVVWPVLTFLFVLGTV